MTSPSPRRTPGTSPIVSGSALALLVEQGERTGLTLAEIRQLQGDGQSVREPFASPARGA